MTDGKEFHQIVGQEFLSGLSSTDLPEIPEQCRGCDVLNDFVATIEQQQTAKEAVMNLGSSAIEGSLLDEAGEIDEGLDDQDETIIRFLMRMQDAGIESTSTAIDGWIAAMQNTIRACDSGLLELNGEVNGKTYTRKTCTSSMQIKDSSEDEM